MNILLCKTGSHAYGVNNEKSDVDLEAVCVPAQEVVFPHLAGHIPGFGKKAEVFRTFEQNKDGEDLKVHNVVFFCQKAAENQPRFLDTLFGPDDCVLHQTEAGKHLRENAGLFLHKGSWHKHKGFAFAQLNSAQKRHAAEDPRWTKPAYHAVRLVTYGVEILKTGEIPYRRDSAIKLLRQIRNGEVSMDRIESMFNYLEALGNELYDKSDLQHTYDEIKIRDEVLRPTMEMTWKST